MYLYIYIHLICFSIKISIYAALSTSEENKFMNLRENENIPFKKITNAIPYSVEVPSLTSSKLESGQIASLSGENRYLQSFQSQHKRSPLENTLENQAAPLKKRNLFYPHQSDPDPYGIVYRNGRAIGYLKPFSNSYELTSAEQDVGLENSQIVDRPLAMQSTQTKREINPDESKLDDEIHFEPSKYTSGRYPEILANFKIGNKLQMLRQGEHKRDNILNKKLGTPVKIDKREINVQQSNVANKITQDAPIKDTASLTDASENLDKIEDNLKGVLGDLGLVDQKNVKRSVDDQKAPVDEEDEDLDSGSNKINVKKERMKKESKIEASDKLDKSEQTPVAKNVKREVSIEQMKAKAEDDASLRAKRQQQKSLENHQQNSDIVKDLESSGELTVSGNKSPLAASSNEHEVDLKESVTKLSDAKQKRELEYERQIEKNLQGKIDAIKQQVKREIDDLKQAKRVNPEQSRKKRQSAHKEKENNLAVKSSKSSITELANDQSFVPHIRSKRMLEDESQENSHSVSKDKVVKKRQALDTDAAAILKMTATKEQPLTNVETVISNEDLKNDPALTDEHEEIKNSRVQRNSPQVWTTPATDTAANSGQQKENNLEKSNDESNKDCPRVKRMTDGAVKQEVNQPSLTINKVVAKNVEEEGSQNQLVRKRRAPNHEHNYQISSRNMDPNMAYTRRKRANAVIPESNMAYIPFRSEDDEVDDEGDEFDDDGFDDRTASLVRKRRGQPEYYSPISKRTADEYDGLTDEDYEVSDNIENEYYPKSIKVVKRNSIPRSYMRGANIDEEDNNNFLFPNIINKYVRKKRQDYDTASLHSGASAEQHYAAGRDHLNYALRKPFRAKRLNKEELASKRYGMSSIAGSDLFGGFPQSYEGELNRFKRVKRADTNAR